jgi:hypothetical protein
LGLTDHDFDGIIFARDIVDESKLGSRKSTPPHWRGIFVITGVNLVVQSQSAGLRNVDGCLGLAATCEEGRGSREEDDKSHG